MATVRPAGGPGCLFTGYTHDFYVRPVYGRNLVLQHDNGVDAVPFGDTVPGPLPPARPALILSFNR